MIKSIIAFVLFAILILSFFFAEKIERCLGLSSELYPSEVSSDEFSSPYFVEYIDVGQGNSTLIKLPDGKIVLIDGGNVPYGETVCNRIKSYGIETIDYMVATHADSDHIGGLLNVLDMFDVKTIFRPFQISGTGSTAETFVPTEDEDLADFYNFMLETYGNKTKISRVSSSVYADFIRKIYSETYVENGEICASTVCVFYDGLKIETNEYSIEFFSPLVRSENYNLSLYSKTFGFATIGYGATDSNSSSAIFLVTILGDKFLFTGDAPFTSGSSSASKDYEELDFLESLTEEEKLMLSNVTVYLVGHHGSKYSSSEKLLSLISPKFSVISVGENNTYGHPADEVLERLLEVKTCEDYILMTKTCGTITFGTLYGEPVYMLNSNVSKENLIISWELLSSVIYCFIVYLIFSIKASKIKEYNWQFIFFSYIKNRRTLWKI